MEVAEHIYGDTMGKATQWLDGLRLARLPSMPAHSSNANLGRWRQALRSAGLEAMSSSPGPLTLLAPTDAAFEALLIERSLCWEQLCADTGRLRRLLLGHVLPERLGAWRTGSLRALGEAVIRVEISGSNTILRDANQRCAQVLGPESQAPNGPVLHRIDRVLLPASQSLLTRLAAQAELSCFSEALHATGLASLLKGSGPFTLFAPDNVGFARLAPLLGLRQRDLDHQPGVLRRVLARHVMAGRWLRDELPWGGLLRDVAGSTLPLAALGLVGSGDAAQSLLPGSDLLASNGVIHRIAQPLVYSPVFPTHRNESSQP